MSINYRTTELLNKVCQNQPNAFSQIKGISAFPEIKGRAEFYKYGKGTIVKTEVWGLPTTPGQCSNSIFGFHIHEGLSCTGTAEDPLKNTLTHYNTTNCHHPEHVGDLPPLFSNGGFAWVIFYTERFMVWDVIGRTTVIHDMPDDFTSQPAGNSGIKIACGLIEPA